MSQHTDITTCSDPEDIYSSRWELHELRHAHVPKEHLDYLIQISDVINKWTTLRPTLGVPCYLHPWVWRPTVHANVYGTWLHYGANPRDEVMCYLRDTLKCKCNFTFPAEMSVLCFVGDAGSEDYDLTTRQALPLEKGWEENLIQRLEDMATYGNDVYGKILTKLNHGSI